MKIEKAIRRVSADGTSVLNAAVAANIGEAGGSAEATATSVQRVDIVQGNSKTVTRRRPDTAQLRTNDKET